MNLLNLGGQIILTDNYTDKVTVNVNTENLKQGVYLVKVETEKEIITERLIVMR